MKDFTKALNVLKDFSKEDLLIIFNTIMESAQSTDHKSEMCSCPYCSGNNVIRYGKKHGKQRFLCKDCDKTFVTTTNTVMSMSHQNAAVWEGMIEDTVNGNALSYSEKRLGVSHQVAFNMRHKILLELETRNSAEPTLLDEVSELDETFVLECYKGKKLPDAIGRPARKHGAKAQKRGISNEYVCICTGAQRKSNVVIKSVNRAKPSSEEIAEVFAGHIADGALLLTDGLRSYGILESLADCSIKNVEDEKTSFYNLNTVNNLHSVIKKQYEFYRGVATKYINRYCTLFKYMYRCTATAIQDIKNAMLKPGSAVHYSISDVKGYGLAII